MTDRLIIPPGGAGGGGYPFIDEQIAAADGDPLQFDTIPTAFRHLVFECSVMNTNAGDNRADDLILAWPGQHTPANSAYQYAYASAVGGGSAGSFNTNELAALVLAGWVTSIGGTTDVADNFATATIKIPYYQLTDRIITARWEAVQFDLESSPLLTLGGAVTAHDGDQGVPGPVTGPLAFTSGDPWKAGSRIAMYGIT